MNSLLRATVLLAFFLYGQVALASPQADARLIAQRSLDPELLEFTKRKLKERFVDVYFKPLSGQGIEIKDAKRFVELIPDKDIAPFLDRMFSQNVENLLQIYTPEQLASIATIMRADEYATLHDVLSEEYQRDFLVALEEARSTAERSGSDDPVVVGIEELFVHLKALTETLKGESGKALAQELAVGVGQIFALVSFNEEIGQIERDIDNPVTIAALKANGILRFANPVQRQSILRENSVSDGTGGVRILKPPQKKK